MNVRSRLFRTVAFDPWCLSEQSIEKPARENKSAPPIADIYYVTAICVYFVVFKTLRKACQGD